jgi:toxin CptA
MTSAPAIGFEYRPSRWIPCLLIVVTALAMPAIALSSLPRVLQTVLAVGVLILCGRALRRLRVPVSAVGWANQGGWSLHGLDGADEPATLLSFKVIQTAVLLRLASRRYGKLTFWLMPDNSDADIRRRLRMRLAVLQADVGESTP